MIYIINSFFSNPCSTYAALSNASLPACKMRLKFSTLSWLVWRTTFHLSKGPASTRDVLERLRHAASARPASISTVKARSGLSMLPAHGVPPEGGGGREVMWEEHDSVPKVKSTTVPI